MKPKEIIDGIEQLKQFCKTSEELNRLRELLPLLLSDNPQDVVMAHYTAIKIVSGYY